MTTPTPTPTRNEQLARTWFSLGNRAAILLGFTQFNPRVNFKNKLLLEQVSHALDSLDDDVQTAKSQAEVRARLERIHEILEVHQGFELARPLLNEIGLIAADAIRHLKSRPSSIHLPPR